MIAQTVVASDVEMTESVQADDGTKEEQKAKNDRDRVRKEDVRHPEGAPQHSLYLFLGSVAMGRRSANRPSALSEDQYMSILGADTAWRGT